MPRYGAVCLFIYDIHLYTVTGMKSPIGKIDTYLFPWTPGYPGTSWPAHPLDACVGGTDEVMSIQCCNWAAYRLGVFKKFCLKIFIRVIFNARMSYEHTAVVAQMSCQFVNTLHWYNREDYRNFPLHIQRDGGNPYHKKNEKGKEARDRHQENNCNRIRWSLIRLPAVRVQWC